jgi:hypothetical protein
MGKYFYLVTVCGYFEELLLLRGGVVRGVPSTATISDLMCVSEL